MATTTAVIGLGSCPRIVDATSGAIIQVVPAAMTPNPRQSHTVARALSVIALSIAKADRRGRWTQAHGGLPEISAASNRVRSGLWCVPGMGTN